jgi:hypothetical protein
VSGLPPDLMRSLVEESGVLSGLQWHPEVDSTNRLAAELARAGVRIT